MLKLSNKTSCLFINFVTKNKILRTSYLVFLSKFIIFGKKLREFKNLKKTGSLRFICLEDFNKV